MSTTATGRLVDENGNAWSGLAVVVRDLSPIIESDLAHGESGADGRFSLSYEADVFVTNPTIGTRVLSVRVFDRVHRLLLTRDQADPSGDTLDLGDVVLRTADVRGFPITHGAGTPIALTQGNAVRLLIDNVEAWGHLADSAKTATASIDLMQLGFELPASFKADPAQETPVMVLEFGTPPLTAANLRQLGPQDDRPERVLYQRANNTNVKVRILINRPILDVHLIGASGILIPVAGLFLAALADGVYFMFGLRTTADEVKRYFDQAGAADVSVHPFQESEFAPMHAKLVFIDGAEAFSIGSPFDQDYFDGTDHAIEDPRRGAATHPPIHDVSVAVRGPAVADAYETFRLHWNTEATSETLPSIPVPPAQTTGGDAIASVQVVRTLPTGRFAQPAEGEKGVLEAYLRAIAEAQQFIYFENQYFTNDAVGDALAQALQDPARPNLQAILLVHIDPDIPLYPRWQRKLIRRLRASLPDARRDALRVFSRWTHEAPAPPGRPRPRIAPVFVHAKVGIVDDVWATVGSANLDGSSLDYTQWLHAITFGDLRNCELNFCVFNGIAGQPASNAVSLLRRRLWAEHLGFQTPGGTPDPDAPELSAPPSGGWAHLWADRAQVALDQLNRAPDQVAPARVLPFPDVDRAVNEPKEYLEAMLVDTKPLDVVRKVRPYDFKQVRWQRAGPELES